MPSVPIGIIVSGFFIIIGIVETAEPKVEHFG